MRRVTVLAVAGGGVLALGLVGFTAWHSFSAKPATAVAVAKDADAEMTTGTVAARWTPAPMDRKPLPAPAAMTPPATRAADSTAALPAAPCNNPDALGISRTIEIDATGGPGLGLSQYRAYDFLQPGEVVLTFDDGPWPGNTPAVLAALAAQCIKATFFPIGKHSMWHPEILKLVVAAGHTVGSHTWSHKDLSKKTLPEAKDEIEKGISAVALSAGRPLAPFFRFPALRQTAELKAYLGERNIAAFSIDVDSQDFKIKKPDQLVVSVMTKLKKVGKGIILMHDFQHSTAMALPEILLQLKAGGYKIVHVTAKDNLVTLPQYDAALVASQPGQTSDARPTASIFRTVSGSTN